MSAPHSRSALLRRCALLAVLSALSSCHSADDVPRPPGSAAFWTLADFQRGVKTGKSFNGIPSGAVLTPAGEPLALLSSPYAPGGESAVVRQSAAIDGVNVIPSFVEGKPAAYLTTEFWVNWTPLWLQPLYVPVTEWSADAPLSHLLPGAAPTFSVDVASTFYSPYWQVIYAVVPAGTDPARLTSAKAYLDGGYPLHEGPGKICVLAPQDVAVATSEGATASVRPLSGQEVGPVISGSGWVEGKKVWFLDFGTNRFHWDEHHVIEETALFDFVVRNAEGGLTSLGLPKVGGTGPYQHRRPAAAPGNRPAFGALWRVHPVRLPPTAGVFIPPGYPELKQKILEVGNITAPEVAPAIAARPDVKDYLLRVALSPACFADAALFPQGCRFLDSQAAIEEGVPIGNFTTASVVINCPLVLLDGARVPNP